MGFFLHMVAQSLRRRFGRYKVTFIAITLSAAAIVLVQAMINGVGEAMVRNAVSIQAGHVQADWPACQQQGDGLVASCESIPGVARALIRTRSIGILTNDKECYALATLYGVDPLRESAQTIVARKIVAGAYVRDQGDIVIGEKLARMLKTDVGQVITFRPSASAVRQFRVCGIYRTGLAGMDGLLAFTAPQDLADSREISLFLTSQEHAPLVASRLAGLVPQGANVRQWHEIMPDLVQLLALDRAVASAVVALVMVILALGVSNTLFLSVSERTREFGILKAMGMTPRGITLLVQAETAMLSAGGALAGTVLGAGLVAVLSACGGIDLSRWTDMNPLFVGSGIVYPRLTIISVLLPAAVVVGCGLLAGLLPSRRAGRISVTAALRSL